MTSCHFDERARKAKICCRNISQVRSLCISLRSMRFQKLTRRERNWERSGIDCRSLLFPHPLPLLAHPLSTSSQFFAHPRRARSLARFFTRLFSSPPGKGKESTSATQATCVSNISSPRLKRRYTRYGFLFLIFLAYTTARCLKKFEGVYLIMNHRKSLLFGYYKRGFRYLEFNLLSPCFDLKVF